MATSFSSSADDESDLTLARRDTMQGLLTDDWRGSSARQPGRAAPSRTPSAQADAAERPFSPSTASIVPFKSIERQATHALLKERGKYPLMKHAIVCLSHMRHDLLGKIFENLDGFEVDVFQSVDDGFEQLWQDGSEVEIVVLQMTEHHVQELWDTALNWPEIRFIAVFVEEEHLMLRPLHNMSIIVSEKPQLLVEHAIQEFVQSR